jgi:indolepyruvate decarboxylase
VSSALDPRLETEEGTHVPPDFTIGQYLLQRLKELGIDRVFGVPGDYILDFIEMISDDDDVTWNGNCNELNAAYAADGYARVKGVAALVVTGGVGDLGAAGGVGGSYAENVPVVVISGTPGPQPGPSGRPMVHHSLGDGRFLTFARIYAEITVAQTEVTADHAEDEIDQLCRRAWLDRKPVFLVLPADVAIMPARPPQQPLDLRPPHSDPDELQEFTKQLRSVVQTANDTVVLVDVGARQFRQTALLADVLEHTGVPWATTWAAKWDLDTTGAGYLGTYFGAAEHPAVARVNNADVLIRIGSGPDEFGAGKADPSYSGNELVDVRPVATTLAGREFSTLGMAEVLAVVKTVLGPGDVDTVRAAKVAVTQCPPAESLTPLTQDRLWQLFSNYLARGDRVVVDTGTCNTGLRSMTLPDGVSVLTQNLWSSIGWSLPALFGAHHAEPSARHILLIGDGAFALTMQEISSMLVSGQSPLLVVLNNGGYVIEDVAARRKMACNDLWRWRYSTLPDAFDGDGAFKPLGLRVRTEDELEAALIEAGRAQADGRLVLLEVVLDRDDVPRMMRERTR